MNVLHTSSDAEQSDTQHVGVTAGHVISISIIPLIR